MTPDELDDEALPEWVDGKAFAGWLEGRRPDLRTALTESQQRTLYRFRTEGSGALDTVDRLCVSLNLHINEIPDWVWKDAPGFGRPHKRSRTYSAKTKSRAVQMLRSGTLIRDVSETLNIPRETIRTWKARELDGKG